MTVYYGYFKNFEDLAAAVDPGLQVPCPCCNLPIAANNAMLPTDPTILTSYFFMNPDIKGYMFFYRLHTVCNDSVTTAQRVVIDTTAKTKIAADFSTS